MNKELQALDTARRDYELALKKAKAKISKLCDFEADITWLPGDGHLILNVETEDLASTGILEGKSISKKLTAKEHSRNSI